MDFSWSPEQLAFKQKIQQFAKDKLNVDTVTRDLAAEFPCDLWQTCADFGILSMSVPAKYNHSRQDTEFMTAMLAMEAMGYGCKDNGLTFALNAQMWTVQLPILHIGTEQQKQKYLPAMCKGEIISAHAMTEAESGSDAYSMQTTATKIDGGYVLNGKKCLVTLAPIADLILVYASTDLSLGNWGITAFLVEKGTPGLEQHPAQAKMGLRTVPIGELTFTDCFVPEQNILGTEGSGVGISQSFLDWERCCILASQLGAMERQLNECLAFAKKRKQFGKSIGKFQAISNRIVEMRLRLETSRLLLYKVAWLKSQGQSAMIESALLKLHLSESFMESSIDAIRIHGGRGYLTEYEIERDLRDAVGGTLYAGTSDIQRNIVAGILGL
jgi:alkylation response protein AidB-like acyl-CoA dehydrogenase